MPRRSIKLQQQKKNDVTGMVTSISIAFSLISSAWRPALLLLSSSRPCCCCQPTTPPPAAELWAKMRAVGGAQLLSSTTRTSPNPCLAAPAGRAVPSHTCTIAAAAGAAARRALPGTSSSSHTAPSRQSTQPNCMPSSRSGSSRQHPATATSATSSNASAGGQQQQPDTSFVSLSELKELCSKALSTIGYTKSEIGVLLEVSGVLVLCV